jgi:integrase
VVRLAALTEARQGELLRSSWSDVDWAFASLTIRGTKTEGSFRKIVLGDLGIALLKEHRRKELEKCLKLGPGATCGDDGATVFTNLVGRQMDAGGLKRTWKRIVKNAVVGHFRFHDLRHAVATYLLVAGAPVMAVSALLRAHPHLHDDGHAHLLPGMRRETTALLESVMVKTWSKAKEA